MARRDILVIGASAGGVEACCDILRGLPSDLPAAIFIAQHVGPESVLAQVLARCAALKVVSASDGQTVRPGLTYVAPPDRHLLLEHDHVKLSRGPRENRQRPSVDVLFRSAARAYRSRVIAVVLTGALHDGSAGAFAVKQRGGVVIVQEPRTALFPSMPESARRVAPADYCVPLTQIPALLINLVTEESSMPKRKPSHAVGKPTARNSKAMATAPFVCPDCSGPLFQDKQGPLGQLRCLVGHSYGPESLSEAHRDALERALLTTMRLLKERAGVHLNLVKPKQGTRNREMSQRFRECADEAKKDVELLRDILERI